MSCTRHSHQPIDDVLCYSSRLIFSIIIFASFFFLSASAPAKDFGDLDFSLIRLGESGPTALVVGGIQGDEPGGFSAATLLATRYRIEQGRLWVVPNLNFPSIIRRSRGLYGDLNRKFALLDEKDPEFLKVRRIQDLICAPEVMLVLNLHDGSGYYRPEYEDNLRNPSRWGQSIIIDQQKLETGATLNALADIADTVAANVNARLLKPLHALHVHNTRTAEGDREMEKSLSYYAVRQGKPAFGLEASKEFSVEERAYYHLSMIEAFLRTAGIKFQRDFKLSPDGVAQALRENLGVWFADNRVFLPLEDVRPKIAFLPLPRGSAAFAVTSKPIMAVLPCQGNEQQICIHYGNRNLTLIRPEWRDLDDAPHEITLLLDGEKRSASFGEVVDVLREVTVAPIREHRVNAIGLDKKLADESGIPLRRANFQSRFSVDRAGKIYRVEIYKGKKFTGMFLLRFAEKNSSLRTDVNKKSIAEQKKTGKRKTLESKSQLPDSPGPESELGF